jgi:hypothetical protein
MNRATQDVEAKGRVTLDDPEWKIKSADSIRMNMEKETGELHNADLFLEQGHISMSGRRLEKFGGQTYHIDDGFFTTCLCESGAPSWKFSAEQMDLTLRARVPSKWDILYSGCRCSHPTVISRCAATSSGFISQPRHSSDDSFRYCSLFGRSRRHRPRCRLTSRRARGLDLSANIARFSIVTRTTLQSSYSMKIGGPARKADHRRSAFPKPLGLGSHPVATAD